jgi:signal transduction histidine kinase
MQFEADELARLVEQAVLLEDTEIRKKSRVNLGRLCDETVAPYVRQGESMSVEGSAFVDGDPRLLRQMVRNLVQNSLKYAPGSPVHVRIAESQGQVLLDIIDEGPGFPPGSEGKAFERFWRAESSRGLSGSGLGLSIVFDIAEKHGGSVSIEKPPAGACVRVILPSAA